jgi:hypothetical protein
MTAESDPPEPPRTDRAERLRRFAIVGLLVVLFGYVSWISRRHTTPEDDGRLGALCTAMYQRAVTMADSMTVDDQRPAMPGETSPSSATCGDLRSEGRLSP